jgi:hypothetical protein
MILTELNIERDIDVIINKVGNVRHRWLLKDMDKSAKIPKKVSINLA